MVKYYEGMFLTHNKEARKETDYLGEHVKELIEKVGGEIAQMTRWDERRLAYPIKGVTHGIYYLTYFTGDSATDSKLRAEVRLSNLILRHLTLKLPEGEIETAIELQNRLAVGERSYGDDRSGDGHDHPPRVHSSAPTRAAAERGVATAEPVAKPAPAPAATSPAVPEGATTEGATDDPTDDEGDLS